MQSINEIMCIYFTAHKFEINGWIVWGGYEYNEDSVKGLSLTLMANVSQNINLQFYFSQWRCSKYYSDEKNTVCGNCDLSDIMGDERMCVVYLGISIADSTKEPLLSIYWAKYQDCSCVFFANTLEKYRQGND